MTIAQAAFALFLLCCIPGFGVCGGLFCEHTKRRWYGGLAIGALGGFFGLCVAGAIAALRHPRYPIEGPPEHTALLYLIPAFVIGIVVVLWLERYAKQNQDADVDAAKVALNIRRGRRLLRGGVILAVMLIFGIYNLFVWSFHRALPWSATSVREHRWSEGFLPDYSYHLKARISEDEFLGYVQRFEMTKSSSGSLAETAPSPPASSDNDWWDPPPQGRTLTYVYERGDESLVAQYHNGCLYMSGFNH